MRQSLQDTQRSRRIIAIHALMGTVTESGSSIVDSYRCGVSPEELDSMILELLEQTAVLLARIGTDEPGVSLLDARGRALG